MIDEHQVREMLHRRANAVPTIVVDAPKAARRARRRLLANGAVAMLAAAAIAVATFAGVDAIRSAPVPADRSNDLGIFAPVAGRIVFENVGTDRGYDPGLWAVDPSGPSDTAEGPSVADDVASTLVPLGLEDATPIGWSSDGTELLFRRSDQAQEPACDIQCANEYLYILHADGSETRLNKDPMSFAEFAAAIAPDGSHVVYAADGVWVVDADGGRPVHLADEGEAPTFSPDGTQVAYFIGGNDEDQVWVANADGSDAHEILSHDATVLGAPTGMQWSPAGDRIALSAGASKGAEALAIYTFAPDGSDFTRVITGGESPYWSPDGTHIAYRIPCEERPNDSCPEGSILRSQYEAQPSLFGGRSAGLAIADADGSNVRAFGFAASGPWHPGVTTKPDEPAPIRSAMAPSAEAVLEDFLQARIEGEGAEGYVVIESMFMTGGVPLLYTTTDGAPYERFEFDHLTRARAEWGRPPNAPPNPRRGPERPEGTEFKVRLFAEGGKTVVEQRFFTRSYGGHLMLAYRPTVGGIASTTENGDPVPVPYGILDGQVTVHAAPPWKDYDILGLALALDYNRRERLELWDSPRPEKKGCRLENLSDASVRRIMEQGPAPADAEALARAIRSDPNFAATAPALLTVGGIDGLRMDVTALPGASVCYQGYPGPVVLRVDFAGAWRPAILAQGSRMRLYLLNVPEGTSTRILAIAIVAPEPRFGRVMAAAQPVLDSIEINAR